MLINGNGNKIAISNAFNQIFDVQNSIQLINPDTVRQSGSSYFIRLYPEVGKRYTFNPFNIRYSAAVNVKIYAYDASGNALTFTKGSTTSATISNFASSQSIEFLSDGTVKLLQHVDVKNAMLGRGTNPQIYTPSGTISYVEFTTTGIYANLNPLYGFTEAQDTSEEYISYGTVGAERKNVARYWEQDEKKLINYLASADASSYVKCDAIRATNQTNGYIRVGTMNVSANVFPDNISILNRMFRDFGVDFVGMQEVKNLKAVSGNLTYPNNLTSASLPYVDGADGATESPHIDNRALSRYPISSYERVTYAVPSGKETQEWRGYTKCVIPLPRYKDFYPNGDQMLSLYATHFDPDAVCSLSEANELVSVLNADTSMFKVVCVDTNDFTAQKVNWKVFTDAGYKQVHNGLCKTAARDEALTSSNSIDQIFVSSNIDIMRYDIINASNYPVLLTNGATVNISDHDFLYADLKLNYGLES